jgi:hypothetical protein
LDQSIFKVSSLYTVNYGKKKTLSTVYLPAKTIMDVVDQATVEFAPVYS